MSKLGRTRIASFGLAVLAVAGWARAQAPAPPAPPAPAPNQNQGNAPHINIERRPGDLPGPIDSFKDVQDSLRMAFMMADQNHDGLISQKEATDLGNLMVGGFFFAADTNGDGSLSKDEAQAARERLAGQNPVLRYVVQRARASRGKDANDAGTARGIGNLLDSNNDQKIEASELRQAVTTGVQGLFAVADTNRDNQLSPTELNAAVYGLARAAMQASFQAADKDRSGTLSKEEWAKAIVEPSYVVFDILDANTDGQLSPDELNRAAQVLASQVRAINVPQADNSVERLIETGRRPDEAAPVPNIPVNVRPGGAAAPGAPATQPRRP